MRIQDAGFEKILHSNLISRWREFAHTCHFKNFENRQFAARCKDLKQTFLTRTLHINRSLSRKFTHYGLVSSDWINDDCGLNGEIARPSDLIAKEISYLPEHHREMMHQDRGSLLLESD